jgi:hypothetical protein
MEYLCACVYMIVYLTGSQHATLSVSLTTHLLSNSLTRPLIEATYLTHLMINTAIFCLHCITSILVTVGEVSEGAEERCGTGTRCRNEQSISPLPL